MIGNYGTPLQTYPPLYKTRQTSERQFLIDCYELHKLAFFCAKIIIILVGIPHEKINKTPLPLIMPVVII